MSIGLWSVPVEVFAFDFDITHAILRLALPLTAGSLLLASAHGALGAPVTSNAAV